MQKRLNTGIFFVSTRPRAYMAAPSRFADFRCKEVINICDGCRLGYVGDVECRLPDGQLTALIIPGPYRFFGLFGRGEEYCIPWECIKQIGDDIILIDKPFPRQEIPRREHRTRRRRY